MLLKFFTWLYRSSNFLLFVCISSAATYGLVFLSQFLGFKPCFLCYVQRYFTLVIVFVSFAFFLLQKKYTSKSILLTKIGIYFCAFVSFLMHCLSWYHLGVERRVFSLLESCSVDLFEKLSLNTLPVRCDVAQYVFGGVSYAMLTVFLTGCFFALFVLYHLSRKE